MKYKPKFPISSAVGKTGKSPDSVIFQRRKSTQHSKRYVRPKQPNSAAQLRCRQAYSQASSAFSNITDEDRYCWIRYLEERNQKKVDESPWIYEKDLFTSVNTLRRLVGLNISTTPPYTHTTKPGVLAGQCISYPNQRCFYVELNVTLTTSDPVYAVIWLTPIYSSKQRRPRKCDFKWCDPASPYSLIPLSNGYNLVYLPNYAYFWDHSGYAWLKLDFYSSTLDYAGSTSIQVYVSCSWEIFYGTSRWAIYYWTSPNRIDFEYNRSPVFSVYYDGSIKTKLRPIENVSLLNYTSNSLISELVSDELVVSAKIPNSLELIPICVLDPTGYVKLAGQIIESSLDPPLNFTPYISWNYFENQVSFACPGMSKSCKFLLENTTFNLWCSEVYDES